MDTDKIALLAKLKAFRNYLSEITKDQSMLSNLESEHRYLSKHIKKRYDDIKLDIQEYDGLYDLIVLHSDSDSTDLKHLLFEVQYALDFFGDLFQGEETNGAASKSSSGDPGTAFTVSERTRINEELSSLQRNLLVHIHESTQSEDRKIKFEQIVASEIEELKAKAKTDGRKKWRDRFLSFALNLSLLFSFSTDARQNISSAYSVLTFICYEEQLSFDSVTAPKLLELGKSDD